MQRAVKGPWPRPAPCKCQSMLRRLLQRQSACVMSILVQARELTVDPGLTSNPVLLLKVTAHIMPSRGEVRQASSELV